MSSPRVKEKLNAVFGRRSKPQGRKFLCSRGGVRGWGGVWPGRGSHELVQKKGKEEGAVSVEDEEKSIQKECVREKKLGYQGKNPGGRVTR